MGIVAYLITFTCIAYASERWSPAWAIGGLLVMMAVARAL